MKLLLDTHVFLWWIADDLKLSSKARQLIGDGENEILFSSVSAWEISIKNQLGKLPLPNNAGAFISEQLMKNGFHTLSISVNHALKTAALPSLHRDPFDRLLVAQSMLERIPIITADEQISQYPVKTIW